MASNSLTPETLVLGMEPEELQELLQDMGFEPTRQTAAAIQSLIRQLGSLDAAIAALHDDQVQRRAA